MRETLPLISLVCLASLVPSASASGGDVQETIEFVEPAPLLGNVEASGGTWLFIFLDESAGSGVLEWQQATFSNTTKPAVLHGHVDRVYNLSGTPSPSTTETWEMEAGQAQLALSHERKAHLIVLASSITVQANLSGRIVSNDGERVSRDVVKRGYLNYGDISVPAHSVSLSSQDLTDVTVRAWGIQYIQWAGVAPTCSSSTSRCPGQGGGSSYGPGLEPLQVSRISYTEAWPQGGSLELTLTAAAMAFGGLTVDLAVNGWVRLPLALGAGGSEATRTMTGNVSLAGTRSQNADVLSAEVSQTAGTIQLDELQVSLPGALPAGMIAVVGGAAAIVAWKLLLALAVRRPLESARRKLIVEYVQRHPGASFREISRSLSLHRGNLGRHILVLTRAKLLVEQRYLNSKRYFENHGKFDETWLAVTVSRDPTAAQIIAFLSKGPSTQSDIIASLHRSGVRRSTVQGRLERLEASGVLRSSKAARERVYSLLA